MATLDDIRTTVRTLPEAVETVRKGGETWSIRDRPFAWVQHPWPSIPDDMRAIVAAETVVAVKVADQIDARALVSMSPDIFLRTTTRWVEPKVAFRLAAIDAGHLAELVTEAWRVRAPKYLRDAFDRAAGF